MISKVYLHVFIFISTRQKNTMYFVCQGIDGITYSPQKRKVLNELKFAFLRKIFRKWLELFKTQLKTFIRFYIRSETTNGCFEDTPGTQLRGISILK